MTQASSHSFPWVVFVLFAALNGVLLYLSMHDILDPKFFAYFFGWPVVVPATWLLVKTGGVKFLATGWLPDSLHAPTYIGCLILNTLAWGLVAAFFAKAFRFSQDS